MAAYVPPQQQQQQFYPQQGQPYPPQQGQSPYPPQQEQPPYPQHGQPPYPLHHGQSPQLPQQGQSPHLPQQGQSPHFPQQGQSPHLPQQGQSPHLPQQEQSRYPAPNQHQPSHAPQPHQGAGGYGLFPNLIPQQSETLVLKEKFSMSGDDFDIKLLSGVPLFKVKGSVLSLSGRKSLVDLSNGRHLFDIQKEHLHIHTTFALNSPEGRRMGEVKSKFAFLGSKAVCTITPDNGPPIVLKMKGGWLDMNAQIVHEGTGAVAATIQRNLNGMDVLFGKQTYHVAVAAGYDMAVIAAMCICLDEKNNEGGGLVF